MHVARWGNSLAIRLPAALVEALALKEGDDIEVRIVRRCAFDGDVERNQSGTEALARIRALRKPLPPSWAVHRDAANAR